MIRRKKRWRTVTRSDREQTGPLSTGEAGRLRARVTRRDELWKLGWSSDLDVTVAER